MSLFDLYSYFFATAHIGFAHVLFQTADLSRTVDPCCPLLFQAPGLNVYTYSRYLTTQLHVLGAFVQLPWVDPGVWQFFFSRTNVGNYLHTFVLGKKPVTHRGRPREAKRTHPKEQSKHCSFTRSAILNFHSRAQIKQGTLAKMLSCERASSPRLCLIQYCQCIVTFPFGLLMTF